MATPGIGDPYWFEWYVGLKNIINMLNPDNGIEYVIFQCSKYNTIDDVVVGYKDGGHEICYQIKHEIFTSKTQNLTFGKLLEQETKTKPCLLCAIVLRFERIASPIREAMHEKYYRQPILFRWLCNSEWLKETLCKHNLHLRYVSRLESIP